LRNFDYFKQTFRSTQLLFSRVKPELSDRATACRFDVTLLAGSRSVGTFLTTAIESRSHDNCAWHRTQFDARHGEQLARIQSAE
jgi:hypothetical protein